MHPTMVCRAPVNTVSGYLSLFGLLISTISCVQGYAFPVYERLTGLKRLYGGID